MQPLLEFGKPEDFARRQALERQIEALEAELLQYQKTIEKNWESRFELSGDTVEERIPEILKTPIEERATIDRNLLSRFSRKKMRHGKPVRTASGRCAPRCPSSKRP